MAKVLTNTYNSLRGFSTASAFVRKANIASKAINLYRRADGTISPRRGYQVQADDIGGLGLATYENSLTGARQPICIHRDGNLYLQQTGTLTIAFSDPNSIPESYVNYEIYVDPDNVSDNQECDFDPYLVMDDRALVSDRIKFRMKQQIGVDGESIGTGSATYSGSLATTPISPASIVMTDGTLVIYDDGLGSFTGDTGVGTNTIDYTTGAYTVTLSGATGALTADYRTTFAEQFDLNLGKGFNEVTTVNVSDLITSLNAVTGITATGSGDTSKPAAFLEVTEATNIFHGQTVTLNWYYWELANRTVSNTFSGLQAKISDDDFRIASFAAYDEAIYIATRYDEIQKYDGQTIFRAGMPQAPRIGAFLTGAGTPIMGADTFKYVMTYEQVDNNGRLVEGRRSEETEITTTASDTYIQASTLFLLQGSGWNTNCAMSSSAQTGVSTIAVDDGTGAPHSIRPGDTVYFEEDPAAIADGAQAPVTVTNDLNVMDVDVGHTVYEGNEIRFEDSTTGETHIRTVISTTATTITFGGASVDIADNAELSVYRTRKVASVTDLTITLDTPDDANESTTVSVKDNAAFSNNLKVNIYRTEGSGTTFYLIATVPNNSYLTSINYDDKVTDTTLALQRRYAVPVREPDPPPKTGVVISYQNQLVFGQDDENDDTVWFSEPSQPEYVSQAFNNFLVPSNSDDVVGLGVSGSTLVVFKDKSIYAVNGSLATSQFLVQPVASGSNIGCVSHHSISPVGGLLYFLHNNGVYALDETELFPTDETGSPIPISIPIDQIFREDKILEDRGFTFKRSVAINYSKDNMYLLFVPAENFGSGPKAANNYSRVFAYDYMGKNWFEWTRVNAAGGWYVFDNNLFWQERILKRSSITSKKYKQHRKYRLIDQVDHVTPIRVTWESSWEDLNQPRVRKKFVRTALLFDEISALFQENVPTLCFYSYKDWVDGRVSTRSDLMQKVQSSSWSTDQWNWIEWSGYQDSFITVPLRGGTVAKALKIGLQLNTINTSFKLQGFQNEVGAEFRKTIVR